MAANLGGVPILFPFYRYKALSSIPVWLEREGNYDLPIEGWYFKEHINEFIKALLDTGYRDRNEDEDDHDIHDDRNINSSFEGRTFMPRPFKILPHIPHTWQEYSSHTDHINKSTNDIMKEYTITNDMAESDEKKELLTMFSSPPLFFREPCYLDGIQLVFAAGSITLNFKPSPFLINNTYEKVYSEVVLAVCSQALVTATEQDFEVDRRNINSFKQNNSGEILYNIYNSGSNRAKLEYYEEPRRRTNAINTARRHCLKWCEDPIRFQNQMLTLMKQGIMYVTQQCTN